MDGWMDTLMCCTMLRRQHIVRAVLYASLIGMSRREGMNVRRMYYKKENGEVIIIITITLLLLLPFYQHCFHSHFYLPSSSSLVPLHHLPQ